MEAERDIPGQAPVPSFKKVLRSQPPEVAKRMCGREAAHRKI